MAQALFLLKRREDYSDDPSYSGSYQIATGMWNSAMFVVDVLNENSITADIEMVIDGNGVDAIVTQINPEVIFIEGLWVTPAKIQELTSLPRHANRKWVVRIHSEIPFLATEGIAIDWIGQYLDLGITVAPNSSRSHDQLKAFADLKGVDSELIQFLPNCYPTNFRSFASNELNTANNTVIDIGCFGAYRPFKNHLEQALVAVRFAEHLDKGLRFHVNDRRDQGGQPAFKNVEKLFEQLPSDRFELIVHDWEDRSTFLQSLQDIDLLMQDSFSETFNIVAADATWVGRPVLGNKEISWLYPLWSDPTDQIKSLSVLQTLWENKSFFILQNRNKLKAYAARSERIWINFIA